MTNMDVTGSQIEMLIAGVVVTLPVTGDEPPDDGMRNDIAAWRPQQVPAQFLLPIPWWRETSD